MSWEPPSDRNRDPPVGRRPTSTAPRAHLTERRSGPRASPGIPVYASTSPPGDVPLGLTPTVQDRVDEGGNVGDHLGQSVGHLTVEAAPCGVATPVVLAVRGQPRQDVAERGQGHVSVVGGGGDRFTQRQKADLVAADQQPDVGEVTVAGGGVATGDHGDQLLCQHRLQGVADHLERLVEHGRVGGLGRCGADRVADVDIDLQRDLAVATVAGMVTRAAA